MLMAAGEDDLQETQRTLGTEAKKRRSKIHLLTSVSAERSSGWSGCWSPATAFEPDTFHHPREREASESRARAGK